MSQFQIPLKKIRFFLQEESEERRRRLLCRGLQFGALWARVLPSDLEALLFGSPGGGLGEGRRSARADAAAAAVCRRGGREREVQAALAVQLIRQGRGLSGVLAALDVDLVTVVQVELRQLRGIARGLRVEVLLVSVALGDELKWPRNGERKG